MQETEYSDQKPTKKSGKQNNVLPLWGNEASMNLNPLILANIQSSSYFKVHLFKLKTYHEVVDEIYYQVKHLEPWERGSRKTAGQTGMCGSVRGVGAGGIVSSAYCLLYKLYTLRLTRKQVNGLITHTDSPYIRGLGFMYIRYSQPPHDLYSWYEDYLEDEEEIDVKAGGGQLMTIGQMVRQWLTKLDWFSTLFPRIPVPIQKQIEQKLGEYDRHHNVAPQQQQQQQQHFNAPAQTATSSRTQNWERERPPKETYKEYEEYQRGGGPPSRERDEYEERRSHKKSKKHSRSRDRSRSRSYDKHKSSKDKKRRDYDDYSRKKHRSRSRERSHRDKDRRKY